MKRLAQPFAGVILALTATLAAAAGLDQPAPAVGAIWAVFCFVTMRSASTRTARLIWWNLGAACLIWVGFELFVLEGSPDREQTFEPHEIEFHIPDPLLGHRPQPNTQFRSRLRHDGKTIYEVTYTFDDKGLRISPPDPPEAEPNCVLFFGCSYTFGEGVNDQETMPYRVGLALQGRAGVRNLGFMGYGPHHMLAAIEGGFTDNLGCRPRHAVLWTMEHHVVRAAGKWWWDQEGPRYVRENGAVVRRGSFGDLPWTTAVWEWLRQRSPLVDAFRDVNDRAAEDYLLYFAILEAAQHQLEVKYPGIRFHVLVWNRPDDPEFFSKSWSQHQLDPHLLSRVLPGLVNDDRSLYMAPDPHPTADSHRAVADYVVTDLLGDELR